MGLLLLDSDVRSIAPACNTSRLHVPSRGLIFRPHFGFGGLTLVAVPAKAPLEPQMGVGQIEQDFALCSQRFPGLIARPIGAQFMGEEVIALFGFGIDDTGVTILNEKHYKLVPPDELTSDDLAAYRQLQD